MGMVVFHRGFKAVVRIRTVVSYERVIINVVTKLSLFLLDKRGDKEIYEMNCHVKKRPIIRIREHSHFVVDSLRFLFLFVLDTRMVIF